MFLFPCVHTNIQCFIDVGKKTVKRVSRVKALNWKKNHEISRLKTRGTGSNEALTQLNEVLLRNSARYEVMKRVYSLSLG